MHLSPNNQLLEIVVFITCEKYSKSKFCHLLVKPEVESDREQSNEDALFPGCCYSITYNKESSFFPSPHLSETRYYVLVCRKYDICKTKNVSKLQIGNKINLNGCTPHSLPCRSPCIVLKAL